MLEQLQFKTIPQRERIKIVNLSWELPVTSQNVNQRNGYVGAKYIIGFIDLKIDIAMPRLSINEGEFDYDPNRQYEHRAAIINKYLDRFTWRQTKVPIPIYVEVKTKIDSLGVLFRQLNTYKQYNKGNYLVVCPDDRHKQTIEEQGFLFFKYDRNLFKQTV